MRGLQQLTALRLAGRTPHAVMVMLDSEFPLDAEDLGVWLWGDGTEAIESLDLRPLVGLPVFVFGEKPEFIKRFCAAATKHKAREVLGFYGRGLDAVVYAEGDMAWLN
jgi:hypothetical protein